jgi:hypothetical protein
VAKLQVIYDFHDDGIKPYTLIIRFYPGELDASKSFMYVPLTAPFQRLMQEELEDSGVIGVSVLLEDLTVNVEKPQCFGIDIRSIKLRLHDAALTLQDAEQFIVRLCDIEEVLQMEVHRYYS